MITARMSRIVLFCCSGLLLLAACSDDDTGAQDDGGVVKADGGGDMGSPDLTPDASVKVTLKVKVVAMDGQTWAGRLLADPTTEKALAGATVAATLPGGAQVEKTAGADGNVTFPGVDWSLHGSASITAYAKGYTMRTVVGLTSASGYQTLTLYRHVQPTTVAVSGTLKNLDSKANVLGVGATTSVDPKYGATGAYTLMATAGKPFTLYATQEYDKSSATSRLWDTTLLGAARVEHKGSTGAITQDIDFTKDKVALTAVKGTLALPTTAGNVATGSLPYWYIRQKGTGAVIGFTEKTTQSGGKFAFEGQYIKLASGTPVVTTYIARVGNDGSGSIIQADGYPQEGATVSGFLHMPLITTPKDTSKAITRTDSLSWTNPEPSATPRIYIMHSTQTRYAWIIDLPPKATYISLFTVAFPSTATATDVFGTSDAVKARVHLCGTWNKTLHRCDKYSLSTQFLLTAGFPAKVDMTVKMYDPVAKKQLEGMKFCVKEDSSIPCVTTTASGVVTLKDVPNTKDVTIVGSKAGYMTAVYPRSSHTYTGFSSDAIPTSMAAALATAMKISSLDLSSKGLLSVAASSSASVAKGATVSITPAAGTKVIYKKGSLPDPSLTGMEGNTGAFVGNLPPSTYLVSVKDKAGKDCLLTLGHNDQNLNVARLVIKAGENPHLYFHCL